MAQRHPQFWDWVPPMLIYTYKCVNQKGQPTVPVTKRLAGVAPGSESQESIACRWWSMQAKDIPWVWVASQKGLSSNYYRLQRSWGKVIFSQASVILSTGRRGACMGGHAWPGGVRGQGVCVARGGMHGQGVVHGGGVHGRGRGHAWQGGHAWHACPPWADTMATAYSQWAGSTHPTGMHSYFF